jgi:phosphatidylserine/phosphatidylglycerophosphate/cardiolipin synthase-like enzyme
MRTSLILFFLLSILGLNAQTIYQIQGQTESSPYVNQQVTTKGIVTAAFSGSYFIQDGDSAWCGLYIYDNQNTPALGDSVEITGTVVEYYDLTEMKTITSFTILNSGNSLPSPVVLLSGEVTEAYEGVLVGVEKAKCTNTNLGYGEWEINDGSGAIVVDDMGIAYAPIENVQYTVQGPLNYGFGVYKIEPRDENDIEQHLSIYFTSEPKPSAINHSGFSIEFNTNKKAFTTIEYGLTTEYELGSVTSTVSSTLQNIQLGNLDAGEVYYAKILSHIDGDTTPVFNGVYATQSNSSGEIECYFNHPEYEASGRAYTSNIVDTLIQYIGLAETSLDFAIYDLTNHAPQSDSSNYKLIQAINMAYSKGVSVRFITDDSPDNAALDSLNPNIPILRGNKDGIMHNKFIIIDVENQEDCWVVTGSTNWTYNNLFMDFNNVVAVQDQSLAKAYTIEFNEMWGTAVNTPNDFAALYGSAKLDNTPHFFNINGTPVELYFSPSDKTTAKMVERIDSAKQSVDFAMMVFTENSLGTAMVNAHNRGVEVSGIIDYTDYSGSEDQYLINNGIDVTDFTNQSGNSWPSDKTLHHKFCVIDENGDNLVVITGTHNWSASAESKNDENTLFISNAEIAKLFAHEYQQIKLYLASTVVDQKREEQAVTAYPNPSDGFVTIDASGDMVTEIQVFDINGKLIDSKKGNSTSIEIELSESGVFFVKCLTLNSINTIKVIVQ